MKVHDTPAREQTQGEAFLQLLHAMEPLKHLSRTGWVDREIAAPESVAAHSWRLALASWLAAEQMCLDSSKALRIALVHDIAEAITGDHTPFDDVAATAAERRALAIDPPEPDAAILAERREVKEREERAAIERLLANTSDELARAVREVWEEYVADATPEAQLVHQLDKLEAYLQGREYVLDGRLADASTLNSFRLDLSKAALEPLPASLLGALERGLDSDPPAAPTRE
jgi:putative hydrolase of HD superfamily